MEEFELEARKEYEEASSDLKKSQPKDVLRRFYPRLDSIIAKSIDESATPLACKKGCSYCCYYKVEAKPVEIFEIVRFAKSKFQPLEIHEILKQAKENVEEAKELSYEQHMATNQKCPFLIGSSCSVYEVRPAKCRNFHATEVNLCKESYDRPTDLSIPNSYNELLYIRATGATTGFEQAIDDAGFDGTTYDLNSAVLEAFQTPKLSKRYAKGKRGFIRATKIEVTK